MTARPAFSGICASRLPDTRYEPRPAAGARALHRRPPPYPLPGPDAVPRDRSHQVALPPPFLARKYMIIIDIFFAPFSIPPPIAGIPPFSG
jgi:hypothetical protein